MKRLLCILLLWAGLAEAVPLVNDRTLDPAAEDSLSIPFWATDSTGTIAAADSLFVLVTGPDGAPTFAETTTVADSRVTAMTLASKNLYTFCEQVSTLSDDGPPGVYHLVLIVRASASPYLLTSHHETFQVVGVSVSERLAIIGGGDGPYSRTMIAYDTAAGSGLPSVEIAVYDLTQSSQVGHTWTDASGEARFNLPAGSLLVVTSCPGYTWTPYDTIVVNGGGTDTLPATRWYPDTPPSALKCRVWGHVYGITGEKEVGAEVTVSLVDGVARLLGVIISPFAVSTVTNSDGFFQIDLVPSSELDPPGAQYEITIRRSDGAILNRRFTVPVTGMWRLTW